MSSLLHVPSIVSRVVKQKPAVIYEDSHLVVVSKPPGLLTLPDRYDPAAPHLLLFLEQNRPRVFVVHRLDRETSGLVVAALTAEAHRSLSIQFSEREVGKRYLALITGTPDWETTTVDLPLRTDADRRHRTRVDRAAGRRAVTHLSVLERYDAHALIEAMPETGRTHQVRVHLAAIGHAIVADALYGDGRPLLLSSFKRNYSPSRREERPLVVRTALHAAALEFLHPEGRIPLRYEAPLHRDMNAAVSQLRKFGSSISEARRRSPYPS